MIGSGYPTLAGGTPLESVSFQHSLTGCAPRIDYALAGVITYQAVNSELMI
jgi:hypothetical protein